MLKLLIEAIMKLFDIHKIRESDNCPLNSLQAKYIIELSEGNTYRIQKLEKLGYVTIAIVVMLGTANLASSTSEIKSVTQTTELLAKLEDYNKTYCSIDNKHIRDSLITFIRERFPNYPKEGLCGLEHKLVDILNSKQL